MQVLSDTLIRSTANAFRPLSCVHSVDGIMMCVLVLVRNMSEAGFHVVNDNNGVDLSSSPCIVGPRIMCQAGKVHTLNDFTLGTTASTGDGEHR